MFLIDWRHPAPIRLISWFCPLACLLQGYVNPKMERLRQGVGPEDLHLVEYIAPSEVPGLLREELPQLKE